MSLKETVLNPATSKSKSLRTTVPMSIINQFNLKPGDKLRWSFKAAAEKIIIIVEPVKTSS